MTMRRNDMGWGRIPNALWEPLDHLASDLINLLVGRFLLEDFSNDLAREFSGVIEQFRVHAVHMGYKR